jgi:hypothetical protein
MHISFEHAKWLKEIGVNIETDEMYVPYYIDGENNHWGQRINTRPAIYFGDVGIVFQDYEYMAYHIWDLIKWLRDNRNIWVWVSPHVNEISGTIEHKVNIWGNGIIDNIVQYHDNHDDAYNSAIETIKNLNLI